MAHGAPSVLIQTQFLTPEGLLNNGSPHPLTPHDAHQIYCGLDSCLTTEVWGEVRRLHPEAYTGPIYQFERALQAPYLAIMQRGFAVDDLARRAAIARLETRQLRLETLLFRMAEAVWGRGLNPRSSKQMGEFFYGAMKLPEKWIRQKGESKLSLNREVLEFFADTYLHPRPIVDVILSFRDVAKQLEVLNGKIDSDGRFRAGYNIAGTETGRPSSSSNAYGTGGNAQNIAPGLRFVFAADPGYKMCVIDLEQVEARDVAWFCGCLFDDWKFLDSCESGDLHTNNARLIWPELPWGSDGKQNRVIAERGFYRKFSYRDMAKKGSHLSNYSGTAWTAARSLKVPLGIMEDFQSRYCRGPACAYPAISRWWQWTAQQLQTTACITTPFGRVRHFFGRPDDPATLREAIAFLPQSTTADRMNLGLWRTWRHAPEVQLLAQTYDSITFQYEDKGPEREGEIVSKILDLIQVPMFHPSGRKYVVPGEAKVGWNWGSADEEGIVNPLGLVKWSPARPDMRKRPTSFLDRIAF